MTTDTVRLLLPPATPLPVPEGQWRRLADGGMLVDYTAEELGWALACTRNWYAGLRLLEKLGGDGNRHES